MRIKDIKTKRPWKRIRPQGYLSHGRFSSVEEPNIPHDIVNFDIVTQADFLREFYPTGHSINDPSIYPDIYREEILDVLDENGEETGKKTRRLYKELVPRYAFAFQQIITIKQIVHLCGNDIQFELIKDKPTESEIRTFTTYREGWLEKDMEIAFYGCVKSVKITGDGAIVGYIENGKFGYKVLSFLNGDTIYPHFSNTGELELFARSYFDYDEEGDIIVEWIEVWDKTYLTRMRKTGEKYKNVIDKITESLGANGYKVVSRKVHGFRFVPVAYYRDNDGPCWSPSQDSIDGFELSFSQMAHNNQAYGEPILVFQGEGENVDINHDLNGTIKTLSMGPDDKASYLQSQSASESYMKQIDTLYKMIYKMSFIVDPPELKSGDLPAAALKILYSPAVEKAMCDANDFKNLLNDLAKIFSYGYGVEKGDTIGFTNLPVTCWIKPYVHVNESAIMADLAIGVQNGFVSRQTASEKATFYTTPSDWDRIIREKKEEQEADLLYQIKSSNNQTNDNAE